MARAGAHKLLHNGVFTQNLAFNLSAIAAIAALVGLGFAYLVDDLSRQNRRSLPDLVTTGPTIEKTIAGAALAIPPAWFRFAEQRQPGFADKIDLFFALPLGPDGRMAEIEVTLLPASRARSSAALLDSVYLHQFTPLQAEGPPGLIGKPLKDIEGFRNETVWYDPVSVTPFVAKCIEPVAEDARAECIRTVMLNDRISATYIFDAELLPEWRRFDAEARQWLKRIGGL